MLFILPFQGESQPTCEPQKGEKRNVRVIEVQEPSEVGTLEFIGQDFVNLYLGVPVKATVDEPVADER